MTILKFKKEKAALTNMSISKPTSHITDLTTTRNDVLYSSDFKALIHCPNTYTGHFDVPQGVEVIGIEAFAGCKSLFSITIPSSVQKISMLAFADCENFKEIILKSMQIIQLSEDSFRGVDKSKCIVHTPHVATYENMQTENWNEFKIIYSTKEVFNFNNENSKQAI